VGAECVLVGWLRCDGVSCSTAFVTYTRVLCALGPASIAGMRASSCIASSSLGVCCPYSSADPPPPAVHPQSASRRRRTTPTSAPTAGATPACPAQQPSRCAHRAARLQHGRALCVDLVKACWETGGWMHNRLYAHPLAPPPAALLVLPGATVPTCTLSTAHRSACPASVPTRDHHLTSQ
jgi:hypothetical protein